MPISLTPAGMIAAARAATGTPPPPASVVEQGLAQVEAVPQDLAQLPLVEHLALVMPAADLLLGGGMLILIMLVHATGVRFVTGHVVHRSQRILAQPAAWRADLLMSSGVFMLLALHLLEMILWAAALAYSGLVPNWRIAGFFAGNTYTTVGYGTFALPPKWEMLAPIISISGLFTFGWSGSVLVDIVGRCQKIKDAAAAKRATRRPRRDPP